MTTRTASCSCGQLSISCRGDPQLVSLCHCRACQKRTGSAYGIAAFFERRATETLGRASLFSRLSDSGHAVAFHFCPDCGSTVFWEPERKPDMIAVAVGCFADSSFPAPTQSVWDDQHRSGTISAIRGSRSWANNIRLTRHCAAKEGSAGSCDETGE